MATVFLSIDEFKATQSVTSIDIVRSPITKKLFASAGGTNYRVQGADSKRGELDMSKPKTFIYDDDLNAKNAKGEPSGGIENGCFANASADNVVGTL